MSGRVKTVEQIIGDRIRARRTQMGLVQEQLAASLGLSYQQIQKYENGSNRITVGRLLELAERLQVPVTYFVEGLRGAVPAGDETEAALIGSRHRPQIELARGFNKIKDGHVRSAIAGLVRTVAERQA